MLFLKNKIPRATGNGRGMVNLSSRSTMNSLSVFDFNSNQVRIVLVDGEPWFVAKDVAAILGYTNTPQAIRQHIDIEDTKTDIELAKTIKELTQSNSSLVKRAIYTNESGLYALIFGSTLDTAKAFKRWVTQEVLPSLRKYGKYETAPSVPKTYAEALLEAGRLALENEKLEAQKKLLEGLNQDLEEENQVLSEAVDELFNYSSIIRIAKFNNVSETLFKWRVLKHYSKQMGIEIKKVPDPKWLTKNLYSHDVWRVAYPEMNLPYTTTLRLPESLD